ncbi:MAG: type II toxin-antitoxin system VapC family toxin [Acidobacteria bacterium]|nr:type II toxin-antitoxin system VapC family toxin [Acidobacteriota bacterium]
MAYLFDTDAISEVLRRRPALAYLQWLKTVPRADQFTSTVVIGELYKGAFRSPHKAMHLENIETRVLPALTVLPFDLDVSRIYGEIRAKLETQGQMLADADLQIAATAIFHDLEFVTGNLRHFERVPGLKIAAVFADARKRSRG